MNGVIYTLHLLEPVLANSLAGDANSAQSLPYIPGGLVRGALASKWLGGKTLEANSPDEATFRRLFVQPVTRYLHAYPANGEQRALPTPLSWHQKKNKPDDNVYDRAFGEPVGENGEPMDDLRLAKFKFYHSVAAGRADYFDTGRQVHIHTQRDAVLGRAARGRGAVYRYESLPAGTRWRGVILTETADDAKTLLKLLTDPGYLSVGKARTAGYGRARLEAASLDENWRERPRSDIWTTTTEEEELEDDNPPQEIEPPETLSQFWLVCLSPLLARDASGQPGPDPTQALSARLGAPVTVERAFRRGEIVGGFNRRWGTYLPQAVAAAAGSVFQCVTTTPVEWATLVALSETGLGERRGEGFGRVAVEWQGVAEWEVSKHGDESFDVDEAALAEEDQRLAQLMLGRMLRRQLDEGLIATGQHLQLRHRETAPSPSQVSRWQVLVRNALATVAGDKSLAAQELAKVATFAQRERDRNSRAWQKMNRARLREGASPGPRLTDWLDELLNGKRSIWAVIYEKKSPKMTLGNTVFEADESMRVEYTLRLIDAVLRNVRDAATEVNR